MGERTGSRVLQWVWSYVHTDDGLFQLSGLIPGYQLRQTKIGRGQVLAIDTSTCQLRLNVRSWAKL
ncbi:hypothetical protein CCHR01_19748 [Colletotrichum chrysophilum]|uniref:Uncharacterized protein n=1 Tax=Colletotrichum chrysophilum TaxID=1836956 RepID=A0AAD8ZY17_9PEZI|nr:hypothetical protein CCHR01_19748 [Colletotrichum chrysophilum]